MQIKIIFLLLIIFFINYSAAAENSGNAVKDLPLIENRGKNSENFYIIFVSGDGGWAKIDQELTDHFNNLGIPVIGLNSQKYFGSKKSPEITASDLGRVIDYYNKKLNMSKVILMGFSFGADILPSVFNLLNNDSKKKIIGLIFLSLGKYATFEFQFSDWIREDRNKTKYPVLNEILKFQNIKAFYIAGNNDNESIIHSLDKKVYDIVILPGDHHFNGNYSYLAKIIYSWISQINK